MNPAYLRRGRKPSFFIGENMSYRDNLCINFVVKNKERLPYGDKDRGKLVPPEKGRRAIFVPSFGTMEKEEVDYVVEVAQEQEDERIRKNESSEQKEQLESVVNAARNAPAGKRAETAQKIINEARR